ncbi:MAG: sugar ABC transporter substrate-binding protein [Rhodobacterales bacterium]|nr:MAG: sugar ABC transporter substrate-binding protein [Rhodobacterales bacterium]
MRVLSLVACAGIVASCGLPRVGPNKREVFAGSVMREGDAFVLTVTDRVNGIAGVTPALGFSESMRNAGVLGPDTIRPGDRLGLTIWENVDDGIVVASGQNATVLDEIQVDAQGFIFVPYAGRIRAAGNSPEAVRRIITEKLSEQTPDPQVQVRRVAGDGASVTLIGQGGAQGVHPIERPTRTLSAMIASAGGISGKPSATRVTVVRGGQRGTIFVEDLFDHPGHDIALRDGDTIILEQDDRSFTALGATGGQRLVKFETQAISAIEAIAQVGGLNPSLADPTGVFVFRNEPEEIAERLTGLDLTGTQRMVYVLDLTVPNGMFMARDFAIRDGDTVYVTEAPFVQFNKTIAALTGGLGQVNAASNLAQSVANSAN